MPPRPGPGGPATASSWPRSSAWSGYVPDPHPRDRQAAWAVRAHPGQGPRPARRRTCTACQLWDHAGLTSARAGSASQHSPSRRSGTGRDARNPTAGRGFVGLRFANPTYGTSQRRRTPEGPDPPTGRGPGRPPQVPPGAAPGLTMTGMYNVLEQLRRGEPLGPKDRHPRTGPGLGPAPAPRRTRRRRARRLRLGGPDRRPCSVRRVRCADRAPPSRTRRPSV